MRVKLVKDTGRLEGFIPSEEGRGNTGLVQPVPQSLCGPRTYSSLKDPPLLSELTIYLPGWYTEGARWEDCGAQPLLPKPRPPPPAPAPRWPGSTATA